MCTDILYKKSEKTYNYSYICAYYSFEFYVFSNYIIGHIYSCGYWRHLTPPEISF